MVSHSNILIVVPQFHPHGVQQGSQCGGTGGIGSIIGSISNAQGAVYQADVKLLGHNSVCTQAIWSTIRFIISYTEGLLAINAARHAGRHVGGSAISKLQSGTEFIRQSQGTLQFH